jgi:hypothetical protein
MEGSVVYLDRFSLGPYDSSCLPTPFRRPSSTSLSSLIVFSFPISYSPRTQATNTATSKTTASPLALLSRQWKWHNYNPKPRSSPQNKHFILPFPRWSSSSVTFSLPFSPVRLQLPSFHSNILVPHRYINSNASNTACSTIQTIRWSAFSSLRIQRTKNKDSLVSREILIPSQSIIVRFAQTYSAASRQQSSERYSAERQDSAKWEYGSPKIPLPYAFVFL